MINIINTYLAIKAGNKDSKWFDLVFMVFRKD